MGLCWAGGGVIRHVERIIQFPSPVPFHNQQLTHISQLLPWDSDSDVQVSEASIHFLASYYNMSVFHYQTPRVPKGRDYMLEVNPHYVIRDQSDTMNAIDARWIDMESGLFIDITTARYNYTHPMGEGVLSCKGGHEYRVCPWIL